MVDYCFESTRRIIIIKISDCDHIRFKEDLPVIVEYLQCRISCPSLVLLAHNAVTQDCKHHMCALIKSVKPI